MDAEDVWERLEKIEPEAVKRKVRELHARYMFDQATFGQVLVLVSITIAVFSTHTITTLQDAEQDLREVDADVDLLTTVIYSAEFNRSLEAIEDVQTLSIGADFRAATETFRDIQTDIGHLDRVADDVEYTYETYQWLLLLAILGIVAGVTIIYI